jgi:hypothetical protein
MGDPITDGVQIHKNPSFCVREARQRYGRALTEFTSVIHPIDRISQNNGLPDPVLNDSLSNLLCDLEASETWAEDLGTRKTGTQISN